MQAAKSFQMFIKIWGMQLEAHGVTVSKDKFDLQHPHTTQPR